MPMTLPPQSDSGMPEADDMFSLEDFCGCCCRCGSPLLIDSCDEDVPLGVARELLRDDLALSASLFPAFDSLSDMEDELCFLWPFPLLDE